MRDRCRHPLQQGSEEGGLDDTFLLNREQGNNQQSQEYISAQTKEGYTPKLENVTMTYNWCTVNDLNGKGW